MIGTKVESLLGIRLSLDAAGRQAEAKLPKASSKRLSQLSALGVFDVNGVSILFLFNVSNRTFVASDC